MKSVYIGIALILASICSIGQERITAQKIVSRLNVHDSTASWEQIPNLYDSKTKVFYGIANDSNTMYICFKVKDWQTQQRIMMTGMAIGIKKKSKKRVNALVEYPIKQLITKLEPSIGDRSNGDGSHRMNTRNNSPQANMREVKEAFKTRQQSMRLKGFAVKDGSYAISDTSSISISFDWSQNNELYYRIAIPYDMYFGNNYTAKDLANPLKLEVTINALEMPSSGTNPGPGGMGGGRSGGGMPPIGSQQGGMSPRGGGMPPQGQKPDGLFQTIKFSQEFMLVLE